MRHQGRITHWKDEQGYGFITPNGGGEPVFLHVKAFARRQPRPTGEEIVSYELHSDGRGRRRAAAVQFVRGTGRQRTAANPAPGRWPWLLAGLFCAVLAGSTVAGKLPPQLPLFYVGASLVAFIAYALDKRAARAGRRRTRESTLHLLALAGGWPGALLAQRQLRHKSAKTSFLAAFWATVIINCAALGCLLSPAGSRALRTALGA